MFGAICGDVLGAPYEIYPVKFKDFILRADNSRYTDDTVCTFAVAQAILDGSLAFGPSLKKWGRSVNVAYGERFEGWIHSDLEISDSAGNGSASRVSSIAWLAPGLEEAADWAAASAMTSHCHPDSIAAAMATVSAAKLGCAGWDKQAVKELIESVFSYDLTTSLDDIRPDYGFRLLARETAPIALRAVIEGSDFEEVLRLAISMGGDADTLAAIAGGVAEAFHPIPPEIAGHVMQRLPGRAKSLLKDFDERRADIARIGSAPVSHAEASRILAGRLRTWQNKAFPQAKLKDRVGQWLKKFQPGRG